MDDRQAFEREIAGVVQRAIGPARPVDAMAVARVASTNSPMWRFPSMFGATKLVVASVIVALFGGFLLSGVLTQQPSDEQVSAVGASASSGPTASPPATPTASPKGRPAEAVLSGLRSTRVMPGITRIDEDADGWQPLSVKRVTTGPDGSVWVVAAGGRVRQVGGDWLAARIPPKIGDVRDLRVADTSTIIAEGDGFRWWDGTRWVRASGPDWGHVFATHGSPNGGLWVSGGADVDPKPTEYSDWTNILGRLSDGEWTWYASVDRGTPGSDVLDLAAGLDGTVWAAADSIGGQVGSGIQHFDGGQWGAITPPGFEEWPELGARAVDVTPDGSVWYLVYPRAKGPVYPDDPRYPEGLYLLQWDGASWTVHLTPSDGANGLRAAPDGTLWLGGDDSLLGSPSPLWRFDGERWWQPVWDEDVADLAITDDGMLWAVTANGRLVLMEPDAVEYTEVVPGTVAAEPAAIEPVDEAEPAATTTTSDLLPGVDLVTEEVEPGVYRVLSDGAGHDLVAEPPVDLTIAPNGDVVLFGDPPGSLDTGDHYPAGVDTVYVLGHDAAADVPGSEPGYSLLLWFEAAVDLEGSLWARLEAHCCEVGNRLGRYDGLFDPVDDEAWTSPTWPDGSDQVNSIEVTDDGTVWLTQHTTGPGPKVARIKDGEWTVLPTLGDGSISGEFHGDSLAPAPDGTVWLSTGWNSNPVSDLPGLLHFDGERWVPVELPIEPRFEFIGPLGLGPDGTLWVYAAEPSTRLSGVNPADKRLLRLQDGDWAVFEDVPVLTGYDRFGARFEVDAGGMLWVAFAGNPITKLPAALDPDPASPISRRPGVLVFDGSTWRQYLDDQVVSRVAVAKDGSAWATTLGDDGGLYVITPEAGAGE